MLFEISVRVRATTGLCGAMIQKKVSHYSSAHRKFWTEVKEPRIENGRAKNRRKMKPLTAVYCTISALSGGGEEAGSRNLYQGIAHT